MTFADYAPVRRLWASVIQQAVVEMDSRDTLLRLDATAFMFAASQEVGSVAWICDALDLDAERLRTACTSRAGRARISRLQQYCGEETENVDDYGDCGE